MPLDEPLPISVGLRLQNTSELDARIQEITDPSSPEYREYLTPEEFIELYGPPQSDYAAVVAWGLEQGLTIVETYDTLIAMIGPVRAINQALCVTMEYRLRPDGTEFFAPDRVPSITLDADILAISGLENYCVPRSVSFGPPPVEGCY